MYVSCANDYDPFVGALTSTTVLTGVLELVVCEPGLKPSSRPSRALLSRAEPGFLSGLRGLRARLEVKPSQAKPSSRGLDELP